MRNITRNFNDKEMRVIINRTVEWFVAKDVCDVLGIQNVSQALEDFPKNEAGISSIYIRSKDGVEQKREVIVVNEPGLYRLVFKSRKPDAEAFKTWVFEEVLPSIRKTGKYEVPDGDRKMSVEARNSLADEWERVGGFSSPLDYIKATKHEYKVLFGDGRLKKEDLDKRQIALLSMMETLESLDLSEREDGAMNVHEAIHHMDDKPALLAPIMERLRLKGVA
jgi:prophage antirepressor-like protein